MSSKVCFVALHFQKGWLMLCGSFYLEEQSLVL